MRRNGGKRVVAVVATLVALVAMLALPAAAAGGYHFVGRSFDLSGDRTEVAVDVKITDGAAGGAIGVSFGFDAGQDATDSILLNFAQNNNRNASRLLKVDGYSGEFKQVEGQNCSYDFRLVCERANYDWVEGRQYRVTLERGGETNAGWLWTMKIKDLETGNRTKLVSLRAPFRRLSSGPLNAAYAYVNVDACSDLPAVGGVVEKPSGAGSSVDWGKAEKLKECNRADLGAAVNNGNLRLSIK